MNERKKKAKAKQTNCDCVCDIITVEGVFTNHYLKRYNDLLPPRN